MAHEGQKVAGEYWILKLSADSGVTYLQLVCEKGSDIKLDRNEIDASSKCGTDKSPGIPTQSLSTDFYLIQGANVASTEASYKKMYDYYNLKQNLYFTFGPALVTGAILTNGAFVGGSGYANGTYLSVPMAGGTGIGAKATITVTGGIVTAVVYTDKGQGYTALDSLSASNIFLGGTGSGLSIVAQTVSATPALRTGDLQFSGQCWVKNLNLTAKNQDRIQITSELIMYPDDTVVTVG